METQTLAGSAPDGRCMSHTVSVNTRMSPGEEQSAPVGSIGRRLRAARTLAELTRRQLAARAQLSPGVLTQIERGETPASASFTTAVARALSLDVDALYGQPYGPALTDPSAEHAGIPTLRAALDRDDDPQPTGTPMTAARLRAELDDGDAHRAAARYAQLCAALPELLHHARALVDKAQPGTETETAWALLSDAYLLAHTVAYHLGYLDLAALCHHHARSAAATSGDPLRRAVAACAHGLLRLHHGDYPGVLRVLERAHTTITDQTSPAADAVRAHLYLRQALTHARLDSAEQADEDLDTARDLIARGVPASPYYTVLVTVTNTDIHWVGVAVELGDALTALDRASQVKIPTGEQPARIARYFLDLARAAALHGERPNALDALREACALAPQLVRYHPHAHETAHFLTEADRRDPDTLAGFARWLRLDV